MICLTCSCGCELWQFVLIRKSWCETLMKGLCVGFQLMPLRESRFEFGKPGLSIFILILIWHEWMISIFAPEGWSIEDLPSWCDFQIWKRFPHQKFLRKISTSPQLSSWRWSIPAMLSDRGEYEQELANYLKSLERHEEAPNQGVHHGQGCLFGSWSWPNELPSKINKFTLARKTKGN